MDRPSSPLTKINAFENGWSFAIERLAQWSNTDGYGHINHASYIVWCEDVRNLYLEHVGLPRLSPTAPSPVLKNVSFEYIRSLKYGDEVLVSAKTTRIRRTSFQMEYAVWSDGLVGRGAALIVLMINATGERVTVPDAVRKKMVAMDKAIDEIAVSGSH